MIDILILSRGFPPERDILRSHARCLSRHAISTRACGQRTAAEAAFRTSQTGNRRNTVNNGIQWGFEMHVYNTEHTLNSNRSFESGFVTNSKGDESDSFSLGLSARAIQAGLNKQYARRWSPNLVELEPPVLVLTSAALVILGWNSLDQVSTHRTVQIESK